jgi:hypothetical protein
VARDFGREVVELAVGVDGTGIVRTAGPLAGDGSPKQLEQAVTIVLAGEVGASYAPRTPLSPSALAHAHTNGGDAIAASLLAMDGAEDGQLDDEVIAQAREILGEEAIERARTLAVELIERKSVTGVLELVADRLLLHGALSGDDLERILDAPAA